MKAIYLQLAVLSFAMAGFSMPANAASHDACDPSIAAVKVKLDAANEQASQESSDAQQAGVAAFQYETALSFLYLSCGNAQKTLDLARDLDGQEPGDPITALLETISYIYGKDDARLHYLYTNGLERVSRGPTVDDVYYYDLTLLLLDKAICWQDPKVISKECGSRPALVFKGFKVDIPDSIQSLLRAIYEGNPISASDIAKLPVEFEHQKNLLLYLQHRTAYGDMKLLTEYAHDEFVWNSKKS